MTLDRHCPRCASACIEVIAAWFRCRWCGWHGPQHATEGPR
jgi:hypothetical protein